MEFNRPGERTKNLTIIKIKIRLLSQLTSTRSTFSTLSTKLMSDSMSLEEAAGIKTNMLMMEAQIFNSSVNWQQKREKRLYDFVIAMREHFLQKTTGHRVPGLLISFGGGVR